MKPPLLSAFKEFTDWKMSRNIHMNDDKRGHKMQTKRWEHWIISTQRMSEHLREDWAFDKYILGKMKWGNGAFQTEKHKQMQKTGTFKGISPSM